MSRRFTGDALVVASHNQGKVVEIAALLAAYPVEILSAGGLGLPAPEETGADFVENAEIKARAAAAASGRAALADDSGICVHALGGEPGIRSARWGGPAGDFQLAMRRIEDDLGGKSDRGAHFVCAMSLCWPDLHCESFEGSVDGHLVWPPRGTLGFGYDPMFIPTGHDLTFGEMELAEKEKISHRWRALEKLFAACFEAR